MAVTQIFPLAATFPAGGDFNQARRVVYAALIGTGLTLFQALSIVQFYLRNTQSGVIDGIIPPASPGDLVLTTIAGLPMLTGAQQVAVAATTGAPLPARVWPTLAADAVPGLHNGEKQFLRDGATVREVYWDGTSWLRVTNNGLVVTPGVPAPGTVGKGPTIP